MRIQINSFTAFSHCAYSRVRARRPEAESVRRSGPRWVERGGEGGAGATLSGWEWRWRGLEGQQRSGGGGGECSAWSHACHKSVRSHRGQPMCFFARRRWSWSPGVICTDKATTAATRTDCGVSPISGATTTVSTQNTRAATGRFATGQAGAAYLRSHCQVYAGVKISARACFYSGISHLSLRFSNVFVKLFM